jgi:ribose transport system substrate-binding protein
MPAQANLAERLHVYKFAFSEHPGIQIIDTVDIKGDPRIAFDTATEIIEKRRDKVDAFVCLEALGGKEVADVLRRNKVIGKLSPKWRDRHHRTEAVHYGLLCRADIGPTPP